MLGSTIDVLILQIYLRWGDFFLAPSLANPQSF